MSGSLSLAICVGGCARTRKLVVLGRRARAGSNRTIPLTRRLQSRNARSLDRYAESDKTQRQDRWKLVRQTRDRTHRKKRRCSRLPRVCLTAGNPAA